jgi:hypothetical protein
MNKKGLNDRRNRNIIKTGSIFEAKIDPAHKIHGELQLPNVKDMGSIDSPPKCNKNHT